MQRGDAQPPADTAPGLAPWPRGVSVCLRFQRVSRKAAWRQRGAAGPPAGAWLAVRGFGSARICVGSCPGRPARAMKGASVCARLSLLTSLCLTEFGCFFPPPSQHTRACVRAWSMCLKKKGKKNKTTHSEGYILARAQEMKTPGQRRRQTPPSWAG